MHDRTTEIYTNNYTLQKCIYIYIYAHTTELYTRHSITTNKCLQCLLKIMYTVF